MDTTPKRSRLRYVDADDLDDSTIDFDGLDVTNAQNEDLGDVDGFIVDPGSGRPYYVVVDGGNWFKSKYYLIPIGHARFDDTNERLVADLSKETIKRYPGFDRDEFEKLSDADLDRFNQQYATACCADELTSSAGRSTTSSVSSTTAPVTSAASGSGWESWSHYRQPDWWERTRYSSTRSDIGVVPTAGQTATSRDVNRPSAERVVAREKDKDWEGTRDEDAAAVGDVSPYPGGRAEPGDVIGIETGGEQTHIGETAKDEDKRRRDAEKDAFKQRKD